MQKSWNISVDNSVKKKNNSAAGFIHNCLEQVGKMTFCPRRKCTSHKKR